jgi:predicted nucleic acid-binding protein
VILADTSAWVEFGRKTGSPVHRRLRQLIADGDEVAVTDPVTAEVATGAKDDKQEAALRALLARFTLLPFDTIVDFDGAVHIYRACRKAGVTPRGLVDCMIAAVALRHGVPILARDADLARIGQVVSLGLDEASLQPEPS